MEIWEPKSSGTLWATPALLRDSLYHYVFRKNRQIRTNICGSHRFVSTTKSTTLIPSNKTQFFFRKNRVASYVYATHFGASSDHHPACQYKNLIKEDKALVISSFIICYIFLYKI